MRAIRSLPSIRSLLGGSAFFALMRIGGGGIGFLTQIALAHALGAHDLGVFYSATSLAIAAGYVMTQGYSQIAPRFAARYRQPGRAHLFAAFVTRSSLDTLWAALATACLVGIASWAVPGLDPAARISYALGGLMVVATCSLTLYTNLAGAMRLFGLCYLPEGLVRPILFLALVLGLAVAAPHPTSAAATALYVGLTIVIAAVQFTAMRRVLPACAGPSPRTRRLAARWRREAWPLVLLSLYTNAFSDIGILFATPFLASADVAVFGACLKLSLLIGYVVQVTQQMAVPDLADARLTRNGHAMRGALRRAIVLPACVTAAATLGCALFGGVILSFFGPGFAHAGPVLVVVVASQLLRALAGPSPHLLTLTGMQGLNARVCAGSLLVLFVGNVALTGRFGLFGAAAAVFLSYAFWIAATAVALARLGEIRTDILALWSRAASAPLREAAR